MKSLPWYHTTTIYQIYPRSFFDSNGDGIGDIQGIIQRLDYIKSLGFETIWCSPFFKSPQQDFGYDISDYTDIAPEYGNLKDVDQLIAEVHQRGMKIVFDMVMNHSSAEHPWFKESTSSRNNLKADWYLWRDKPTSWSTWTRMNWHYMKERNQYYWASFLSFQPDINYRNPEAKKAMMDMVEFWLEKGVDGYRLDMFNAIYKDAEFRKSSASRKAALANYDVKEIAGSIKPYLNQPESFELAKELRALCDSFGAKMLLGEVIGPPPVVKRYLGNEKNNGLGLAFDFEMMRFRFNASYFHRLIARTEKNFPEPFMPVYVFSNHDRRRSMKRLNGNVQKAKLLHLLQLTVRGVPCIYYGEEIGMEDKRMPYSKALDPIPGQFKFVPRFVADIAGETLNRDEVRTPMQWDASKNAGFSSATKTWLPINTNFTQINVDTESRDESSLLLFVKRVLKIRNEMKSLHAGNLEFISKKDLPADVLGYKRKHDHEEVMVLMNFSKKEKVFLLDGKWNKVFLVNKSDGIIDDKVSLGNYGGLILIKQV